MKKVTCVILMILIGLALTGCGKQQENPADTNHPEKEGDFKEEEPEKDWFTLEEELEPAVVRVECGDSWGSGVIWEITEERLTVVTSGHLLKNRDDCDVVFFHGVFYTAQVEKVPESCDIGFAVLDISELDREDLQKLRGADKAALAGKTFVEKENLIEGQELAVYGSMDYAAGNFVKAYLLEAEEEVEMPESGGKSRLMLCGIQTEQAAAAGRESGAVDAGMSGSGVFDRQGRLVGILSGGDGESFFAAVPVWQILGTDFDGAEASAHNVPESLP